MENSDDEMTESAENGQTSDVEPLDGGGIFRHIVELSRHSVIYGVAVLSRVSAFVLLPLHTNYLTQYEYGILTLVLAFIGVTGVFYLYGINVSFLRYYVTEKDASRRKEIFSTCFLGIAGVAIVLSVVIFLSAGPLAGLFLDDGALSRFMAFAAAILLFDALFALPQIALQAQKRPLLYVAVVFVNVGVNLGLNYLFLVRLGWAIDGVLAGTLAASVITFLILLPVLARNLRPVFSSPLYLRYVKFGAPYIASMLFIILIDLVDRFMLQKFLDAETVALYAANYKLGAAMAVLVNAFRLAWHPFYLSLAEAEEAKRTFARVFTYFLLLTCGIFLAITLFIADIVRIPIGTTTLIAPQYWPGLSIVPVVLFAYMLMGAYVNFVPGIQIREKTIYSPVFIGAGLAVNVILNLILIPRWHIYGAAIATAAAYAVMTVTLYVTVQKFYYIRYEWQRVAKILLATGLIFALHQFYLQSVPVTSKFLLLGAYPAALYVIRFFEPAEWRKMKTIAFSLARGR